MSTAPQTEQVRRFYDKTARRYDRQINFMERILFGRRPPVGLLAGHRRRARDRRRNWAKPALLPDDARVTGIELSPQMLELAAAKPSPSAARLN